MDASDSKGVDSLPDDWTWERFELVDAGNGEIALWSKIHNRFMRMNANGMMDGSGTKAKDQLPSDWTWERFTVVTEQGPAASGVAAILGGAKVMLHSKIHNRFVRMNDQADMDTSGQHGPTVPPPEWTWERFTVVDASPPGAAAAPVVPLEPAAASYTVEAGANACGAKVAEYNVNGNDPAGCCRKCGSPFFSIGDEGTCQCCSALDAESADPGRKGYKSVTLAATQGMLRKKFAGYFNDDMNFAAFAGAPVETEKVGIIDIDGNAGDDMSYMYAGMITPPAAGFYSFKTRSDDASYVVVNGKVVVDNGGSHGAQTREGTAHLDGPSSVLIYYGNGAGGSRLEFEWKGGGNVEWTKDLAAFEVTETPTLPDFNSIGMTAKKYDGYFNDDLSFPAFSSPPKEEKLMTAIEIGNEGDEYSYMFAGTFHPPTPGAYTFRTRSDDSSYVIVDGEILVDNGHTHGARTREGTVHLTGPAAITVVYGEKTGGAKIDFEWLGGRQDVYTPSLALFTPLATPVLPPPFGMTAQKFDGYFEDDFSFAAFSGTPVEEKLLPEIKIGNEGDMFSYLFFGTFHPPEAGDYSFRTRSDDASYIIVDGKMIVDNGHTHGSRTREATIHLTGPALITVVFGEKTGGARCDFEWRGGTQAAYTARLGLFTPLDKPTLPAPFGMKAKKYNGYFEDNLGFAAFSAPPAEEKLMAEINLGNEGDEYSYVFAGTFHPPDAGEYSFRTRSDDASYVIVNGKMLVDNGHTHGGRTREGTVHLTGPASITVVYGEKTGGAGMVFQWSGGRQQSYTGRLGLFTPLDEPVMPPVFGMTAKKYDGYFEDDFSFAAFSAPPVETKLLPEIRIGNEGDMFTYLFMGTFHPSEPGEYTFRTRSDDASYIIVDGKMLTDNGHTHGSRTIEGTIHLNGPAVITVVFGEKTGGARCDFEWRGGRQAGYTARLGQFTPLDEPTLPAPFGMAAKKYNGYFEDNMGFEAFKAAPAEEKLMAEINLGNEGDMYSYVFAGTFHPPEAADYSFRTRSDDASYVYVNGKMLVDNGHTHGGRTREGTVHLSAPANVVVVYGEKTGGASMRFEWSGGPQRGYTGRLALFTPVSKACKPKPADDNCYLKYCNAHPDLQNAFCGGGTCVMDDIEECASHWEKWGKNEGRVPNPEAPYLTYCNAHPDLQAAFCGGGTCTEAHLASCKQHWQSWGKNEGRIPNPEVCPEPGDDGVCYEMPAAFGMKAKKYSGYFNDDFDFAAFKGAPTEEKLLPEIHLGNEGTGYTYLFMGTFHPPEPGNYKFRTRSDDASYVSVDGKLLVDNGERHGGRTREGEVHLSGPAVVTVVFGQDGGGAQMVFEWAGGNQRAYTSRLGLFTPLDSPTLPPPMGLKAKRVQGYYHDNLGHFANAAVLSESVLKEINLGDEGSDYSYIITGTFNPPSPGEYFFRTRSDDSSKVFINGNQVVDNYGLHGMVSRDGRITLDGPAKIEITFGELGGGAGLKFDWRGGSQRGWTTRLGQFTPV
jgi:hypothetical protein